MTAPGEASAEPGVITGIPNRACAAGDRDQPMSYTNLLYHIVIDQITSATKRRKAAFWLQSRQQNGAFDKSVFD